MLMELYTLHFLFQVQEFLIHFAFITKKKRYNLSPKVFYAILSTVRAVMIFNISCKQCSMFIRRMLSITLRTVIKIDIFEFISLIKSLKYIFA